MLRLFCLLALLAAPPAFAISSPDEMLPDRAQEQRAEAIGARLRCLVCQNNSIEDSEADLAKDLRRIIRQRVAAGDTDTQAVDWVVARYGDFVRLQPPFKPETLLLWASPLIAVGIGAGAVLLARRRRASPPPPLTDAERADLAKLLKP